MYVHVVGGVFAGLTQDQFPVALYAPEVLQGIVRISGGHVENGMGDAENRFAFGDGFSIEQVDAFQIRWSVESCGCSDGWKEVDRVG